MKRLAIVVLLGLCRAAIAQESPTPTPTPEETASPSPVATATPTPAREVRLRFVPPPMDGTISLGIFDEQGKLVRVLHREANIDNFTIEADSLSTIWDGKNDAGEDAPPGKYRARGFEVGQWKVEQLEQAEADSGSDHVSVKTVENPLVRAARSAVDLAAGSDMSGTFVKTADGLPLFTISKTPNVAHMSISKNGKRTVDVWQSDGATVTQFRVSNVDQMMEFDCGTFGLK